MKASMLMTMSMNFLFVRQCSLTIRILNLNIDAQKICWNSIHPGNVANILFDTVKHIAHERLYRRLVSTAGKKKYPIFSVWQHAFIYGKLINLFSHQQKESHAKYS